jgi:hypothetical protein
MISTVTPTGGIEGYNKEEGADIQNMTSTRTQIKEK